MKNKYAIYNPEAKRYFSPSEILAQLIKNYPGEKFSVFLHASDNGGTRRIDIRRVGTYSPAMIADNCEARWRCKSESEQKLISKTLQSAIDSVASSFFESDNLVGV